MSIPTYDPDLKRHIETFNPHLPSRDNEALKIMATQKLNTLIKIIKKKKQK